MQENIFKLELLGYVGVTKNFKKTYIPVYTATTYTGIDDEDNFSRNFPWYTEEVYDMNADKADEEEFVREIEEKLKYIEKIRDREKLGYF